jgi:hypothetical protein
MAEEPMIVVRIEVAVCPVADRADAKVVANRVERAREPLRRFVILERRFDLG